MLTRDALMHLPLDNGCQYFKSLPTIAAGLSKINITLDRAVIEHNSPIEGHVENEDIAAGGFAYRDLQMPPFNVSTALIEPPQEDPIPDDFKLIYTFDVSRLPENPCPDLKNEVTETLDGSQPAAPALLSGSGALLSGSGAAPALLSGSGAAPALLSGSGAAPALLSGSGAAPALLSGSGRGSSVESAEGIAEMRFQSPSKPRRGYLNITIAPGYLILSESVMRDLTSDALVKVNKESKAFWRQRDARIRAGDQNVEGRLSERQLDRRRWERKPTGNG